MVGCLSGDARNIHQGFFIKSHYWNLNLSIVALSNVLKCPPKNEKKNHQKDASHLKNNKNSSHGKINKKDIEKHWSCRRHTLTQNTW